MGFVSASYAKWQGSGHLGDFIKSMQKDFQAATATDLHVRNGKLGTWTTAPSARAAHPREEHLMPLMVIAGAAGPDVGRRAYYDRIGGKRFSGYEFG